MIEFESEVRELITTRLAFSFRFPLSAGDASEEGSHSFSLSYFLHQPVLIPSLFVFSSSSQLPDFSAEFVRTSCSLPSSLDFPASLSSFSLPHLKLTFTLIASPQDPRNSLSPLPPSLQDLPFHTSSTALASSPRSATLQRSRFPPTGDSTNGRQRRGVVGSSSLREGRSGRKVVERSGESRVASDS